MPVITVKKIPGKPQLACLKFPPKIKFCLLVCRSMQVLYKEQGRVIAQKTPEVKSRFSFLFFSLPDSADISCPPSFSTRPIHSFSYSGPPFLFFPPRFPGKKNKNKGNGERGRNNKISGGEYKKNGESERRRASGGIIEYEYFSGLFCGGGDTLAVGGGSVSCSIPR